MAPDARPVRWYETIPPHVFLFCFVTVLGCSALANALPRLTGDVLYQGPLESGVPVTFHVPEADTTVYFDVTSTFPFSPEQPRNASVVVHAPDGSVVFNTSAFVHGIPENTQERNARVLVPMPVMKPSVAGDYTITYQFHNGTLSSETAKVTQGGLAIRHGPPGFLFYSLLTLFLLGLVMLFFVRGGTPDAKGFRRLLPVRGATGLSLSVTIVLGLITMAVLLYIGGGGLA